jgi:hypothetical protein
MDCEKIEMVAISNRNSARQSATVGYRTTRSTALFRWSVAHRVSLRLLFANLRD